MVGIYKITNKVNGKIYIGQTIDFERRKYEHIHDTKNRPHQMPLHYAMKKYGVENFEFSILEECDRSELDEKEKFYINAYKSNNKNIGYNISNGGNDCSQFVVSKSVYQIDLISGEIIAKYNNISEASEQITGDRTKGTGITACCKGKIKSIYGYAWCYPNDYSKDKYCNYKEKCEQEKKEKLRNYRLGKKHTKDEKIKIGMKSKGRKRTYEDIQKVVAKKRKRVLCIETNVVYPSVKETAKQNGFSENYLIQVLKGKQPTLRGCHWKYYEGGNYD